MARSKRDYKPTGTMRVAVLPQTDILSGPLNAPLLRLALPMLAGFLFQIGFNFADTFYVAYLGKDALAAVSSTMFVVWALMSIAEVVTVGVMSLVARSIGAGDGQRAGAYALNGGVAAFALSLVVSLAGVVLVDPLVGFLGLEARPQQMAADYLGILFLGYPTLVAFLLFESAFRGAGDTKTPMVVLASTFLLNILLDRILIFGLGPIPAFGVSGAAAATVCARGLGGVVLFVLLLRKRRQLGIWRPQFAWLSIERLRRIVAIGAPASAAGLGFCVIYMVLVRITSQFGTGAIGALGLGIRLESLAFFVALALGRAAATIGGQNLGAGQFERVRLIARRAEWLGCGVCVPLGLLMAFVPEPFVRLFIDDPEVVVAASAYLRILSWTMPLMVVEVVLDNVASGVGDTLPAMVIEILGTALRIPIALGLVALGAGYISIWWAVAVTLVMKAAGFELWFRFGRWAKPGANLEANPDPTGFPAAS